MGTPLPARLRCGRMRAGLLALVAVAACSAARDEEHFARAPGEPGSATNYEIDHRLAVPIPQGAKRVRIWFTKPQEVPEQVIRHFTLKSNVRPFAKEASDDRGNAYLYWDIRDPVIREFTVRTTFLLTRSERRGGAAAQRTWPYSDKDYRPFEDYLGLEDEASRELAADILRGELNPVTQAKLLYRWALANADHYVKDPSRLAPSGRGSAAHVLEGGAGDAEDLAALFVELARAGGLPARFLYGSLLTAKLDGTDVDQGWHCWAEFHAPGLGWVPVDLAVGDIYEGNFQPTDLNEELVDRATAAGYSGASPRLLEYYFGNVDDRRITWSRGRHLKLRPGRLPPVRAVPVAYVDMDGRPAEFERTLTYRTWRQK